MKRLGYRRIHGHCHNTPEIPSVKGCRYGGVRRFTTGPRPRRAAVTLELILNLPLWIAVLLAVVEFGQLHSNTQQLTLASRVGVEEASETSAAAILSASEVPANIVGVIRRQLESARLVDGSGVARFCVILQHDLDGVDQELAYVSPGTVCDNCAAPVEPPLPDTSPDSRFVRLTVCVPFTSVAPNLLTQCGPNLIGRQVRQTTTFMHQGAP